MSKPSLSVAIISYNEENNIRRCLAALQELATEIIIVDSGSQDKTLSIAKEFDAKIVYNQWPGYVAQKNLALSLCMHDWILCLDADETVSAPLKKEILQVLRNPQYLGYTVNLKLYYQGKLLQHSAQPDRKLRLVNKKAQPKWCGDLVHESLKINAACGKLEADVIHYSYQNLAHQYLKMHQYAKLSAQAMLQQQRKFKYYSLLCNPCSAFVKQFILKRGFLDGMPGFCFAASTAIYAFLKYLYLWELEQNATTNESFTQL